jgi:hypothetical protein
MIASRELRVEFWCWSAARAWAQPVIEGNRNLNAT